MTINHNMMISKRRNGDMISTLPDDVICHILSFLETKYAFRTSVLSTRWKNLFSLVPVLSFNEPYVKLGQEKNHDKFINFVYKMLLTYKLTDMQSFVVDYNFLKALNSHIHAWVSAAIICNVRALRLSIDTDKLVQLPRDLCNSKTLVELILEGYFTLNLDNSVCLPSLKKLYLDHGHMRIEGSKNLSLSIFPVLEDLVFDCVFDPGVSFDISIFSLKKLTLRTYAVVPNIVLNTPVLEVLDILGVIANISGNVLVSLFKARFGILTPFENVNGFHNLIKMCSNVHNLYLYDHAMEALGDYELTRFQNLTRLKIELTSNRNAEWKLLPILLESSPNLQILNFKVEEYHPQEYVEMEHLLDIRDCEISSMHLKELQVRNFTGHENEFKLVEYILKNVKALNKVIIRSRKPLESKKLIIQRLIAFPRCSEDCQFMVIDNSRKMLKKKSVYDD